jgi:hypothetical protein
MLSLLLRLIAKLIKVQRNLKKETLGMTVLYMHCHSGRQRNYKKVQNG